MDLIAAIHETRNLDELAALGQLLPEAERQNHSAGYSAAETAHALSSIADCLTLRLIGLFQEAAGPTPVEYSWLAVGSLARREFVAHGDQDNALLFADGYSEAQHGRYFSELAQFVCDGLAACGVPRCHGDVMASNTQWRQPLSVWRKYFGSWISSPERKAMMLASNFFDMRVIAGGTEPFADLNAYALGRARNNGIFLSHLAANALQHKPPRGFLRRFVILHSGEFSSRLDLKLCCLMPIVELARLFALTCGSTATRTTQRFREAEHAGSLSTESATRLCDAFELCSELRMRRQVQQHADAQRVDGCLEPQNLSEEECARLKAAFAAIRVTQNGVALRFQTGLIA